MPEKPCRECGEVPSEGKIGRGGRCDKCGEKRMLLQIRLSGVSARMASVDLEGLLFGLEEKYGRSREPWRWEVTHV